VRTISPPPCVSRAVSRRAPSALERVDAAQEPDLARARVEVPPGDPAGLVRHVREAPPEDHVARAPLEVDAVHVDEGVVLSPERGEHRLLPGVRVPRRIGHGVDDASLAVLDHDRRVVAQGRLRGPAKSARRLVDREDAPAADVAGDVGRAEHVDPVFGGREPDGREGHPAVPAGEEPARAPVHGEAPEGVGGVARPGREDAAGLDEAQVPADRVGLEREEGIRLRIDDVGKGGGGDGGCGRGRRHGSAAGRDGGLRPATGEQAGEAESRRREPQPADRPLVRRRHVRTTDPTMRLAAPRGEARTARVIS
jgi:hypothetical protein